MVRLIFISLIALICFTSFVHGKSFHSLNLNKSPISSKTNQLTNKLHLKEIDNHQSPPQTNLKSIISMRGGRLGEGKTIFKFSFSTTKFILQVILTTFNVLCWLIPLISNVFSNNHRLLSLANSFAGGIFLMLTFSHLIPESLNSTKNGIDINYQPLNYVIFGFVLMLFVEKVFSGEYGSLESTVSQALRGEVSVNTAVVDRICQEGIEKAKEVINLATSPLNPTPPKKTSPSFKINSAVILCLAMSIHSFFESAALGLARNLSSASLMFSSLALHQPAESLAMLVACLKSDLNRNQMILLLVLYSSVALFGNLAGLMINSYANPLLEAKVMAITAGSFLYVGATEIICEEFESNNVFEKIQSFLAYISGIASMFLVNRFSSQWEF